MTIDLPPSFDGAPALPSEHLPAAVRDAVLAATAGGEPFGGYLYDLAVAVDRSRELRAALPDWAHVHYAVKANAYRPLLEALAPVVEGFEIASVSETALVREVAAATGVPVRATSSGPGKTPALLAALATTPGVTVVAESVLELHRLSAAAVAAGRTVPVALRVNPDAIPAQGSLVMGGVASAFGLPEAEVPDAVALARSLPGLDVTGFHVHAVSGNLDAASHAAYAAWCLEHSVALAEKTGVDLRLVDAGGGLGVPFEGEPEFDVAAFGRALGELTPPPGVRLVLEPGRWTVAACGWYAATVLDVKQVRGSWFAVVRGGINHFQLPTSWDIRHPFAVVPVDAWPAGVPRPAAAGVPVTIAGELCTPEDLLARDMTVERLRAGDVVVFPNAGSYGYEFAMPAFLGHPPATRATV